MRALVALVLIVSACGGGDDGVPVDPHSAATCDHTWTANGYTECEAACAASGPALQAKGPACQAQTAAGPVACSKTFVFQDITGCCSSNLPQVLFGECE